MSRTPTIVTRARALALEVHAGQKHGRTTTMPEHLRHVWQLLRDLGAPDAVQAAAWLHHAHKCGGQTPAWLYARGGYAVHRIVLWSSPAALGECPQHLYASAAALRCAERLVCARQAWGCNNLVLFRYHHEHDVFRQRWCCWLAPWAQPMITMLDDVLTLPKP